MIWGPIWIADWPKAAALGPMGREACRVGVVAVRVSGEYVIDLLSQNLFSRMSDGFFRPRIGQPPGRFRQNAEFLIQLANREQASITNDLATVKCHRNLLPSHFKKLQLLSTLCLGHRSAFRVC